MYNPYEIAASFREVTKAQFYAALGRMNVHPRSEREASYWETPDRRLMGKTTPGYMGGETRRYFVSATQSVLA